MDLQLRGRRALVTGASKGIGLAVVEALAAECVDVVAGARSARSDMNAHAGPAIHAVDVDLSASDGPDRLTAAAADTLGGQDILVNNVGGVRPRTGGFPRHQ